MIEVANLTKIKINTKFLQKAAHAAFAVLNMKQAISLVFVGDKKMQVLNRKYRRKNCVTDVLSFEGLNEIFICLPQAGRQAKSRKIPLNCELTRLLVHGIVHLKGYNHVKSARQAKRMFGVEEKILEKINIGASISYRA